LLKSKSTQFNVGSWREDAHLENGEQLPSVVDVGGTLILKQEPERRSS